MKKKGLRVFLLGAMAAAPVGCAEPAGVNAVRYAGVLPDGRVTYFADEDAARAFVLAQGCPGGAAAREEAIVGARTSREPGPPPSRKLLGEESMMSPPLDPERDRRTRVVAYRCAASATTTTTTPTAPDAAAD